MKPTKNIKQKLSQEKSKQELGTCKWNLTSSQLFPWIHPLNPGVSLKTDLWHVCSEEPRDCKDPALWNQPENFSASLLWMFPPSYRSQKDFGCFVGPAVPTCFHCRAGTVLDLCNLKMWDSKQRPNSWIYRPAWFCFSFISSTLFPSKTMPLHQKLPVSILLRRNKVEIIHWHVPRYSHSHPIWTFCFSKRDFHLSH